MPYSASTVEKAPNVAVSTTSTPSGEEGVVHPGDDVGAGQHQVLVAALEVGAAEVVGVQVEGLDVGAEGAVVEDDALRDRVEE